MNGKNGHGLSKRTWRCLMPRQHEFDSTEVTDDSLSVTVVDPQGATSADRAATAARVTFSRKLHYLLANLTTDAARLVVRQNYGANGFETWRRLVKKFALPDATRHVSLLTQLLDFKINPQTFEQDFNTWETIKVKYEGQTGTALPDSVLVATLLNKTSGALQTHLGLNERTLTTYEQIRATIIEYHQSRHILTGASSSSNQGPAPRDIGGLKGKKGFGKGGFGHFKGKKGKAAFNDFFVAGTCDDSSVRLPTWELSPAMYHLPHQDELGCESSLFRTKTLQDWGLGHLDTSFFDPYLAEHESVVASVGQGNDETWILFDSGAAANCCPPDFAPEFPLLQLDERAPPLKSISGQTLNICGRKLVAFEIEGKRLWLIFCL